MAKEEKGTAKEEETAKAKVKVKARAKEMENYKVVCEESNAVNRVVVYVLLKRTREKTPSKSDVYYSFKSTNLYDTVGRLIVELAIMSKELKRRLPVLVPYFKERHVECCERHCSIRYQYTTLLSN